ncbi:MAG: ROK family protein [Candidatus Poribacteria bacterium]|nr:ROK family protein [Candidatus Poribacteria bacterium]
MAVSDLGLALCSKNRIPTATNMKYSIGIDLGGTNIKGGLLTTDGKLSCRTVVSTHVNDGAKAIAARIAQTIQQVITEVDKVTHQNGDSKKEIIGIGLGSPGLIVAGSGIIHFSPNFPGWTDIPLLDYVSYELGDLGIPLYIDNDVNVMVLGELHHGAGIGYENIVGLTIGTGVGGGVVINRKVYHGSWNTAGELGHTVVQPNGRKCGCGNQGCLEAYAGARHIVERTQQQIIEGRKTCLNPEGLTPKQIAEAAAVGDELAQDIFAETGKYIGIALTSIAHILNPQIAIIGGGIAAAGEDLLFQHIREEFKRRTMDIPGEMEIVPAKLGNEAGLVGAAMLPY